MAAAEEMKADPSMADFAYEEIKNGLRKFTDGLED